MKTVSKKSTFTIITLSCLLAVAVASTIILAAFSAVRTSTTTITFANGVEMSLASKNTASTIQITQDPNGMANVGTFDYSVGTVGEDNFAGYEEPVTLDGITATISRDAWVAYQIVLTAANTSAPSTSLNGTWTYSSGDTATFTAANNAWTVTFTFDSTDFTATGNGTDTLTVKSNARWATGSLTQDLFASIAINATDINALAGKQFVANFTIKADTSDGIGASNDQNPITFTAAP